MGSFISSRAEFAMYLDGFWEEITLIRLVLYYRTRNRKLEAGNLSKCPHTARKTLVSSEFAIIRVEATEHP